MFAIGLMAVCSIHIDILYDDMPLHIKINSAYGTITRVIDDQTAVVNFEEYIDKYNFPHTKVVGDYSEVKVREKDCIPF